MKHNIGESPRDIVVKTRLSYEEKIEFDNILKRTGLSQAEYLRCAIFGTPIQEAPKIEAAPLRVLRSFWHNMAELATTSIRLPAG